MLPWPAVADCQLMSLTLLLSLSPISRPAVTLSSPGIDEARQRAQPTEWVVQKARTDKGS